MAMNSGFCPHGPQKVWLHIVGMGNDCIQGAYYSSRAVDDSPLVDLNNPLHILREEYIIYLHRDTDEEDTIGIYGCKDDIVLESSCEKIVRTLLNYDISKYDLDGSRDLLYCPVCKVWDIAELSPLCNHPDPIPVVNVSVL